MSHAWHRITGDGHDGGDVTSSSTECLLPVNNISQVAGDLYLTLHRTSHIIARVRFFFFFSRGRGHALAAVLGPLRVGDEWTSTGLETAYDLGMLTDLSVFDVLRSFKGTVSLNLKATPSVP